MLSSYSRMLTFLLAGVFIPSVYASSLQDFEFNVNGTDYYPAGGATLATVPGLASGSFNSTSGIGSLTLTFNPGKAGNYYLGAWFFDPVAIPFYNEYGLTSGSVSSGETWQIDIPEYDTVSANHGSGTILDNLAAGMLKDINTVPGQTSNYLNNCGANGGGAVNASCNDMVSMALGFNFSLKAGYEEVLTLALETSSANSQGGITLEDVHPVDGSNPTASTVYYTGSLSSVCVSSSCSSTPPPPTVPEPASWTLLAVATGILGLGKFGRSRIGSRN